MIDVIAAIGAATSMLLVSLGLSKGIRRTEIARILQRWDTPKQSRRKMSVAKSRRSGKSEPVLSGLAEKVAGNRLGRRLATRANRLHPSRPFSDVLAIWSSAAMGGAIAGWLLFGGGPLPIVLAVIGPLVADRVMIRAGGRRTARIEQQLPEAFALQSSALRAGNSLSATLRLMSHELPPPLGDELSITVRETELGNDLTDALARLSARVGSRDVALWVTAMTVHRRTGGSLPKILESLGTRIRERTQMRAEVRALTAQGRLSGLVVAGAPVGFFLLLSAVSRDQMSVLYSSPLGLAVLALGVAFQVIGFVWIRRILRIPE